jgi:exo-poly-alpha-galacturonosidase
MNGNKIGSSLENSLIYSNSAKYIINFYKNDKNNFYNNLTLFNSFYVTNLIPNTIYKFTIRSLYLNGKESKDSTVLIAKTAKNYKKVIIIYLVLIQILNPIKFL